MPLKFNNKELFEMKQINVLIVLPTNTEANLVGKALATSSSV